MTRLCLVWLALVGWAVAASYATELRDDEFASPTPKAWKELVRAQGDTIERLERRLAALESAQSIARQAPPGEPAAPRRSLTEEPTAAVTSTSALVRSYPARRNVEESRLDAFANGFFRYLLGRKRSQVDPSAVLRAGVDEKFKISNLIKKKRSITTRLRFLMLSALSLITH